VSSPSLQRPAHGHQHGRRIDSSSSSAVNSVMLFAMRWAARGVAGIASGQAPQRCPRSRLAGLASPPLRLPNRRALRRARSHGWRCVLGGVIQLERHDRVQGVGLAIGRRECAPAARRGPSGGQMPASHRHLRGAAGELNVRGNRGGMRVGFGGRPAVAALQGHFGGSRSGRCHPRRRRRGGPAGGRTPAHPARSEAARSEAHRTGLKLRKELMILTRALIEPPQAVRIAQLVTTATSGECRALKPQP